MKTCQLDCVHSRLAVVIVLLLCLAFVHDLVLPVYLFNRLATDWIK